MDLIAVVMDRVVCAECCYGSVWEEGRVNARASKVQRSSSRGSSSELRPPASEGACRVRARDQPHAWNERVKETKRASSSLCLLPSNVEDEQEVTVNHPRSAD
jgi:hypothetical protein